MIYQVVTLEENKRKFNYVSDAVNKLYGVTVEEIKENPNLIYDRVHKDDVQMLIKKENEAMKKMAIFKAEVRVINPDGSIRWSYLISKPRIINNLICWDGIEVDISEQKEIEFDLQKAKEKAEESEKKYRSVVENMIDGFYKADVNGNATLISPSVTKLLGFDESEIIGQPISSFYAHPDERKIFLETLKKNERVEEYSAEFIKKGCDNIIIETNCQFESTNRKYFRIHSRTSNG